MRYFSFWILSQRPDALAGFPQSLTPSAKRPVSCGGPRERQREDNGSWKEGCKALGLELGVPEGATASLQ